MTPLATTFPLSTLPRHIALLALCVLAAAAAGAQTQIVPDPNAKRLRMLWYVEGPQFGGGLGGGYVGNGVGGLWDIYGTGTNAWAVQFGEDGEWRIYNGYTGNRAIDTLPVQRFSGAGSYPIVGDFWGTGSKAVVFVSGSRDTSGPSTKFYTELLAHRTESHWIDTAIATHMNTRTMSPIVEIFPHDFLVTDLDEDGADELILTLGGVIRDSVLTQWGEFWIFKGGPDFQLDTPSTIIKVPMIGGVHAYLGDFDGDNHTDLVTWDTDPPALDRFHTLSFYFGDGTLDGYARPENRRVITLGDGYPRAHFGIEVLDCDGDGRADLVMNTVDSPEQGVYFFRSRTGKNARTRSYMLADADNVLAIRASYYRVGHLNDSTRRFDMLMLYDHSEDAKMLSGGENGPDSTYDAYYSSSVFGRPFPAPDIDGDGWDDLIVGSPTNNFNAGLAVILAGGPEIPRDPTMGVEAIAGEGHAAAISTWPNPARDLLHIAWRGDLRRMPHRFIVHDILGRKVATGDVEPDAGAAIWHCGDIPSGVYLLSIYDRADRLIATQRIIKRE